MSQNEQQCEEIRRLLADRVAGQLDEPAVAKVEGHVAACAACRSYAEELAATDVLLASAPSLEPSAEFDARLAEQLRSERDRERAERVTVLATLAAGLRRLRQFELGVAVYPLVLLCVVYVMWAIGTRRDDVRIVDGDDGGGGVLIIYPGRDDTPEPASRALARVEADAVAEERTIAPIRSDPYVPMLPDPEFDRNLIGVRVVYVPQPAQAEPKTVAEFEQLPEPDVEEVKLPLPTGAPGGSRLARARFLRIKHSRMRSARRAISKGVVWLIKHQDKTGYWASASAEYSRQEVTAAATLALMESGFAPSGRSTPSRHLRAGLTWLLEQKQTDGMLAPAGARQWQGHTMACVALSEALRLTDDERVRMRFREDVQAAVGKLAAAQPESGAWGNDDPELTAMVVMAAGAARAAGLAVDAATHRTRLAWLESEAGRRLSTAYASEGDDHKAGPNRSYYAIGVILGSPDDPSGTDDHARRMARSLAEAPVVWGAGDFFRWYAGTLAAYQFNGGLWRRWRGRMLEELLRHQEGTPPSKAGDDPRGSWAPHAVTKAGGPAYSTALAVLSLTASYGHSPLYGGSR